LEEIVGPLADVTEAGVRHLFSECPEKAHAVCRAMWCKSVPEGPLGIITKEARRRNRIEASNRCHALAKAKAKAKTEGKAKAKAAAEKSSAKGTAQKDGDG